MLYYVPSVNYPQPMQKYLFILLLLIFSCDEALGPEDCAGVAGGAAVEDICGVCSGDGTSCYGCTDATACNFDATATIFDNSCEYEIDICGVCAGSGYLDGACNCNGDTIIDCAGVCAGTEIDSDEDGLCDIWETVIDIDGNIYNNILIGNQIWMQENLKTTHYRNGDEIPTGYTDSEWKTLSTGAYSVYPADNDLASQTTCGNNCADIYGNLYNGYVVNDERGICPQDWHIPTRGDWDSLVIFLQYNTEPIEYISGEGESLVSNNVGGAMKSTGTMEGEDGLWFSPNVGATNESGFKAYPSGSRGTNQYYGMGERTYIWLLEFLVSHDATYTLKSSIVFDSPDFSLGNSTSYVGHSIRCLKD